MKLRLTVVFVSLICSFNTFANELWKKDYSKIDSIAKAVEPRRNLKKLVSELTDHCHNDVSKYRSIFTWVAHHIEYDLEALRKPALRETDPEKIIKRGKAVCAGYSSLFKTLCEQAGLECVTITGWAKERTLIGKDFPNKTNHAWSAIRIENEWYLCDVTWAAGNTTEEKQVFTFEFNDSYFCTPPELFAYCHFPEDKQWFLGGKVSKKKFMERPHFYSGSIRYKIQDVESDDGTIKYRNGDSIDFQFSTDVPDPEITICWAGDKFSKSIAYEKKGDTITFRCMPNRYVPFLYIYLNSKAILGYKIVK